MAERIKFHLDEHVDPTVAKALRQYGIDVTTTADASLRTHADREHIEFIRQEGRVLVTHDVDFLRFASRSSDHPGIAFSQMGSRSSGEMIRTLILIYEVLSPEELTGLVEYL